jgi:hypothetical protein
MSEIIVSDVPVTPNIGLRLPEGADAADVDDFNYNMDKLDTEIQAIKNKGSSNAGKFLVVGNDGAVTLLAVQTGGSY